MILGDNDLQYYLEKGKLVIEPLGEKTIRENGIDLTIGDEIAVEENIESGYINDVIDSHFFPDITDRFEIKKCQKDLSCNEHFIIEPMSLNLFTTREYVKFGDDIMGLCGLRSTVARHGFIAPLTIIDAGFEGTLTIEVIYAGKRPFKLYVGDRFLHVIICKTNSPVKNIYNGVYKGQKGIKLPKVMD